MDTLVYLLPVLGCAAMMGVMMLMMRGGQDKNGSATPQPDPNTREEIALLRAEIAAVLAAQNPEASAAQRDPASKTGGAT